jgi:hypothetical protein
MNLNLTVDTETKDIYSPEKTLVYSYDFTTQAEQVENFPQGPHIRGMRDVSFIINPQRRGSIACIDTPGVMSLEITGRGGEVKSRYGTPNYIGKELGYGECFYLVTLKDRDAVIVADPKRQFMYFYLWHKSKLIVKPVSAWPDTYLMLRANR